MQARQATPRPSWTNLNPCLPVAGPRGTPIRSMKPVPYREPPVRLLVTLTLVASADHPEDHACARYIEALIRGEKPELDRLLEPLYETERYRRVRAGAWPGFPASDLELALVADRFAFAMPVTRQPGYFQVNASS